MNVICVTRTVKTECKQLAFCRGTAQTRSLSAAKLQFFLEYKAKTMFFFPYHAIR